MDKRLLIVDDEKSLLGLLEARFQEESDFEVVTADSAEAALQILNKKRYPIIITDLKMPGMTGLDLCKKIRETNPISYIIAMTGYQDFFELKNCRAEGFDDYFKKPFEFSELLEEVKAAHRKMDRWDEMLSE
ncbi:MAG: response regulator [Lentisphaeraceae bacterium]|nr:response regulator [Lentisphaeraceae bacterium]